jgi:hypothetical protein
MIGKINLCSIILKMEPRAMLHMGKKDVVEQVLLWITTSKGSGDIASCGLVVELV